MKKTIYVADLSDSIRELVDIALKDYIQRGYEIERFSSGSDLKQHYICQRCREKCVLVTDKTEPDLIILSNDLPGARGIEFIEYARKSLMDKVPIIMASRRSALGELAQEYDFIFIEKDAHFLDNLIKNVDDFLGEPEEDYPCES